MKKLIHSFQYAFAGIKSAFKSENNLKIHFLAAIIATVFGFYFNISEMEWTVIILLIAIVFSAEMFNTAIEHLCDLYQTEFHPKIKLIKDISAAAVLVIAIAALIIGCIIFIPKFSVLF